MKLEEQVCSLELSKKLKELGVKQESYFRWLIDEVTNYSFVSSPNDIVNSQIKYNEKYSAFTAPELLEILPYDISTYFYINKGKSFGEIEITYYIKYFPPRIIGNPDKNLCNACAKMLIYLIENKLMEI